MTLTHPDTDTYFARPYIDLDEWRTVHGPHRYVHGGFDGTDTRFSFSFPPPEAYEGRFHHYITPVPDSEHVSEHETGEEDRVGFALASGAYFVETNGGGPAAADLFSDLDPLIGAYLANAAAAEYSRTIAMDMYGTGRPFGYAYGGSGGGFRTIGGMENTTGVWDGAVPHVIGSPVAMPNCFTARMQALRVLRDRFDGPDGIVDAMAPGGSGDPYRLLDEDQRAALLEVTRLGFPIRSWFGHAHMGLHGLSALYPGVRAMDPTYFEHDFWNLPGYAGADPAASLHRDLVQHRTTIAALPSLDELAARGFDPESLPGHAQGNADDSWLGTSRSAVPLGVRLSDAPVVPGKVAELVVQTGPAAGARLVLLETIGDMAVFGPVDERVLAQLREGDEVVLDNSGLLAIETYHRHQDPGPEFRTWDQFRDDDGSPLFPQRPMLIGPIFAKAATGTLQSGRFAGKMIVVESLYDREAYPWQADWYRSKVAEHLGAHEDERFRLWVVDHALHGVATAEIDRARSVSYAGHWQQALRDVAAWVETGFEPAATTAYEVADGQLSLPATAEERRGVQPVVQATVAGSSAVRVLAGETVTIHAEAAVPGTGAITAFEWDVLGTADFAVVHDKEPSTVATDSVTVRFDQPGVFFPGVQAIARRDPDDRSAFARLRNVATVRVVVDAA